MSTDNTTITQDTEAFLAGVLPAEHDFEVFVAGSLDRPTDTNTKPPMRHSHAVSHEALAEAMFIFDANNQEAYFALARFKPHTTKRGSGLGRQSAYATAVKSFWLDVDCGLNKNYATKREGVEAFYKFIETCDLPVPTYMVDSGGGVHVYFALAEEITPDVWIPVAKDFKLLCEIHNFNADPSRTADIASVLRPPGTHNHKTEYGIPRPVLIKRVGELVAFEVFNEIIRDALANTKEDSNELRNQLPSLRDNDRNLCPPHYGPPDLEKLESALAVLDPDCEEQTWKLKRIAPLARAAKEHPELRDRLKELTRRWSRGDLYAGGAR